MSDDESPRESQPEENSVVKNGKVVLNGGFNLVKIIAFSLVLFLLLDAFLSLKLFVSAVKIRSHIGYFINMVSSGDGEILPSLQAVPVLFFLIVDIGMCFCLFKSFDDTAKPQINRIMFVVIIIATSLLCAVFVVIIVVISHAHGSHESLHDGIVKAMNDYSSNVKFKAQIDMLQIEFQCCGSKKYDEWYTINWTDASLEPGGGVGSPTDGNTPFSCCSMHSLFPCIHHNIEITGTAYLYTPESNLSVSTRGCYEMIREKKQEVGWSIVLNLLLFFLLQAITITLFRFIQTAHCVHSKFVGHSEKYTMWLIGSYAPAKKHQAPPSPPPVPDELKDEK